MSRKIGPILCCVAVLTCVATVSGATASIAGEPSFPEHQRSHWAFQPVAEPDMPASNTNHPIDAFVSARLRGEGIRPAARADRTTLIRRATFDLHGLPPTPAEVQAFVEDDSPVLWVVAVGEVGSQILPPPGVLGTRRK